MDKERRQKRIQEKTKIKNKLKNFDDDYEDLEFENFEKVKNKNFKRFEKDSF
jgi:hypothetical protein